MRKLNILLAGVAIGATAVALSDKKNREALGKKAKQVKDFAVKEVKIIKKESAELLETAEKKVDVAKKAVEGEAELLKRKGVAAVKAARDTK